MRRVAWVVTAALLTTWTAEAQTSIPTDQLATVVAGKIQSKGFSGLAVDNATVGGTQLSTIASQAAAALSPTTPLTAVLGTVSRTLPARFSDSLYVKDYGAKCDGATDDTAALQAAINVATGAAGGPIVSVLGVGANPNGGAKVVLPSGACAHSGTLTANMGINSSFAIVGDGTSNTQLIMTGHGDGLDINFASNPRTSYGTGGTDLAHSSAWPGQAVWIRGINLQNGYPGLNGVALAITGTQPIYANQPPASLIEDVAFSDVGGYGAVTAQSATPSTSSWGKALVVTNLNYLFAARLEIVDHTGLMTQGIEYQTTASASTINSYGAAQNFICQDCIQFGGQNFVDIGGYGVQTVYLDRPQWHTSKLGVTWLSASNGTSGSLYVDEASGSSGVADLHATGLGTVSVHDGFWYAQGAVAGTPWHGLWYDGDSWVQSGGNTVDGPGVGAVASGSTNTTFAYGEVLDNLQTSNLANLPSTVVGDTAVGVDYGFQGSGANVAFGTIQCSTGVPTCFGSDYAGGNPALNPHWSNVQDGTNTVWADAGTAQQIHASLQSFFGAGLEVGMPGVPLPGVGTGAAGSIDFHSAAAASAAALNDEDVRLYPTGGVAGTNGQGTLHLYGAGGLTLDNGPLTAPNVVSTTATILGLEIGSAAAGGAGGQMDLHYAGAGNDYDVRLVPNSGTPGTVGAGGLSILGTGGLTLNGPLLATSVGVAGQALTLNVSFVSSTGSVLAPAFRLIGFSVPTSSSSPCDQGTSGDGLLGGTLYHFFCYATNSWSRVALVQGGW